MREQRTGTLLYVGSTTTVSVPPFLGPYVASKFAFDALAQVTAYEVAPLGIETVIVMPGAFTRGTDHFPHATRAADQSVAAGYTELDPLIAGYDAATERLYAPAPIPTRSPSPSPSPRRSPSCSPCRSARSPSAASSTSPSRMWPRSTRSLAPRRWTSSRAWGWTSCSASSADPRSSSRKQASGPGVRSQARDLRRRSTMRAALPR
jgi:NAD(P)-dependent dehydrogenase (short-subunit alcohol dehydrogenase family)